MNAAETLFSLNLYFNTSILIILLFYVLNYKNTVFHDTNISIYYKYLKSLRITFNNLSLNSLNNGAIFGTLKLGDLCLYVFVCHLFRTLTFYSTENCKCFVYVNWINITLLTFRLISCHCYIHGVTENIEINFKGK